jgi:hypothetical protein
MNARFTSKADIDATQTDVCFVPIADSCSATNRKTASRGGLSEVYHCWSRATLATFRLMHFRVYFQSTGALSGVSEFRLGAGW